MSQFNRFWYRTIRERRIPIHHLDPVEVRAFMLSLNVVGGSAALTLEGEQSPIETVSGARAWIDIAPVNDDETTVSVEQKKYRLDSIVDGFRSLILRSRARGGRFGEIVRDMKLRLDVRDGRLDASALRFNPSTIFVDLTADGLTQPEVARSGGVDASDVGEVMASFRPRADALDDTFSTGRLARFNERAGYCVDYTPGPGKQIPIAHEAGDTFAEQVRGRFVQRMQHLVFCVHVMHPARDVTPAKSAKPVVRAQDILDNMRIIDGPMVCGHSAYHHNDGCLSADPSRLRLISWDDICTVVMENNPATRAAVATILLAISFGWFDAARLNVIMFSRRKPDSSENTAFEVGDIAWDICLSRIPQLDEKTPGDLEHAFTTLCVDTRAALDEHAWKEPKDGARQTIRVLDDVLKRLAKNPDRTSLFGSILSAWGRGLNISQWPAAADWSDTVKSHHAQFSTLRWLRGVRPASP